MHIEDQLADERDLSAAAGPAQEVEDQAALLIAVATGGPQAEYQRRRLRLTRALRHRGLDYPFPWHDLWRWYSFWGNLGGYAPRRAHVRDLLGPVLDALAEQEEEEEEEELVVADPGSEAVASWAELDARVAGLTVEMSRASTRDDLQDVGRRAREVLIACAKLLADPALVPSGSPEPRSGDAKAWLELFLKANAGGPAREELRRLVRNAWDLAQKVTHGDVQPVEAFAAAQATVLVVRTLQKLACGARTTSPHPIS